MKTFYLAHNFYTRKQRHKWQLQIESKYNIKLDCPFYNNASRNMDMKIIDSMKDKSLEQEKFLNSRSADMIISNDLEKIRKSDGVIAFAENVRVGTIMEIFFASYVLRLPVYIYTKKFYEHPWIKKFASRRFRTIKELEQFIKERFGERNDTARKKQFI